MEYDPRLLFRNSVGRILLSTVRIEASHSSNPGIRFFGTGVVFEIPLDDGRRSPWIFTNKHVIEGCDTIRFNYRHVNLNVRDYITNPESMMGSIGEINDLDVFEHPQEDVDLCAIGIGRFQKEIVKNNKRRMATMSLEISSFPTRKDIYDMDVSDEILMVGYPTGLWDSVNQLPIARKGMMATHIGIPFEGRGEFVIDMACYPGSSGSPIFRYSPNKSSSQGSDILFLGMLYAGPQYNINGEIEISPIPDKSRFSAKTPMHLGYAINSQQILDLCVYMLESEGIDSSHLQIE